MDRPAGKMLILAAALAWAFASPAVAQPSKGSAEIWATIGGVRHFLDRPAQSTVGGSVRYYLTRRLAVQPGVMHAVQTSPLVGGFEEWTVVLDVAYDFPSFSGRVSPYVIAGGGWFRSRDTFINFTSHEATASGGGGIKYFVTEWLFLAPAARFGIHAYPQITFSVGLLLSAAKR